MKPNFLPEESIPKNISKGAFFVKKIDISQNKLSAPIIKYGARVTELITHDEVTQFDGTYFTSQVKNSIFFSLLFSPLK